VCAVLGSVALWLGAASPGYACCGFFAALFGHHPAPAYSTFYGPPVLPAAPCCAPVAYRPVACCPSPCDPCAPLCGPLGCPAGACDIGLAPPGMVPIPDGAGARPRTFVDDPQSSPMGAPPADEGFRPRGSADEYDRDPPADSFGPGNGGDGTRESFRPDSVIPRRDAPPSRPAETATEGDSEIKLRLPAFDLDDKITWRQPPERTRLIVRASYRAPAVARHRAQPNEGWLPAPQDTQLVRK
jgi:hypothetical protein